MLDLPYDATHRLLAGLRRASLLEKDARGRWAMHDLLRLYADERGRERAADDQPEVALNRLYQYYGESVRAATRWTRQPKAAVRKTGSGAFTSRREARAWLDDETASLVAAITTAYSAGRWTETHTLATELASYFEDRCQVDDWITTGELAAPAADHLDQAAADVAAIHLGQAYRAAGQYDRSIAQLERARSTDSSYHVRSARLHDLGLTYFRRGNFEEAERLHRENLELCYEAGDMRGATQTSVALGDALRRQGRLAEAAGVLQLAIDAFHELDRQGYGDDIGLMNASQNLALVGITLASRLAILRGLPPPTASGGCARPSP